MRLGITPDAKQEELLRSETRRGILNCSRQWGKSTVAAIRAVHRAYTRAESLVVVASASRRQSAELLHKCAAMLGKLGIAARGDGVNVPSAVLPNGSRIAGLPGRDDTTRGFSAVSLLLIDEAARVSDDMYKSLRPMLAMTDGDLWLMSTPKGDADSFMKSGRMAARSGRRSACRPRSARGSGRSFWRRSAGVWGRIGSGRSICASSWRTGATSSIRSWWRRRSMQSGADLRTKTFSATDENG